jgi:superfamily II DNA or RNA helicase
LTGTTFINSPSDIASAALLIHPNGDKYFPASREGFDILYKNSPKRYVKNLKHLIAVYHDDRHTSTKPRTTFHEKTVHLDKKVAIDIEKIRHQHKFSISQINAVLKKLGQHGEDDSGKGAKDKKWTRVNAFLGKVRQASNGSNSSKPCSSKVEELVKTAIKGPKPALIYSQFIKHGIQLVAACLKKKKVAASKIGIFTGSLSLGMRKKLIEKYNDGNLDYLLITRAASEGVDLKGTRQIHVLEPYWNPSSIEQIFGRGVRLNSHTHLPKKQQHVDLYMWLGKINAAHLKRHGISSKEADEMAQFSPDVRLFEIAKGKNDEIQKYKKLNLEASIPTDIQHAKSKPHVTDSLIKTKKSRKLKKSTKSRKPTKSRKLKKSTKSRKPTKSRKLKKSTKSRKPTKSRKLKKSTKARTSDLSRCQHHMPPCPQYCHRVKRFDYTSKTGKKYIRQAHCRR